MLSAVHLLKLRARLLETLHKPPHHVIIWDVFHLNASGRVIYEKEPRAKLLYI